MNRFRSNLEHLLAEIEKTDLRLRLQLERFRERHGETQGDAFRGLFISEDDIDELMAHGSASQRTKTSQTPVKSPLAVRLEELENGIAQKTNNTLMAGVRLRLCELVDKFDLTSFELDILLICMLPEIDLKYEKIFAYLHDDVTKKRSSVNLILKCLSDNLSQQLTGRDSLQPQASLVAHNLISIDDDPSARCRPLLSRGLKVEDRVVNFLLESDRIDPRLEDYTRLLDPKVTLRDMVLPDEVLNRLMRLAGRAGEGTGGVFYFQGQPGVGKKTVAEALCHSWNLPLLTVDVSRLAAHDINFEKGTTLVFREAKLQGAAICWIGIDQLFTPERNSGCSLDIVIEGTRHFHGPVFATGEADWQPGEAVIGIPFFQIGIPAPSCSERARLWTECLEDCLVSITGAELEELAGKFRLTGGQIKNAAVAVRNIASCREGADLSLSDMYGACRYVSNRRIGTLARKIQPKFRWEDIVLPRDPMAQLREITNCVRYRHAVYEEWDFDRKLSLGRGLNVLFAGPSGTGKTMASEIIANELGLDLYKIDLATIVSKYIGETEKNLDKVFDEAQNSNAILFFDEADAIFGKRSEVRDSHDRYANIEIAYLLQKMEEYDGIAILATNLRKNLDEAFARRMHFCIEFPLPEERDRYLIWQGVFPEEAPVSEDVDLDFMAQQFKITGGNIKNIALGSAFLAAADGGTITIEHLIRATKREYQKIGRLCTETDFAQYFDLVKG